MLMRRNLPALVSSLTMLALCISSLSAATLSKTGTFGGLEVHYKVLLPEGYTPAREYPVVLAFGPGAQTMVMVETALARYWGAEGNHRGYIVVSPAAPEGHLFFEEGARIFPEFLDMILHDYKVQGGKMHIGGLSNGGASAFHIASLYPKYFWSVTGFPGLLRNANTAQIEALRPMCIYMDVGSRDTDWREPMQQQAEMFKRMNYTVQFHVEENQDHVLNLGPEGTRRLFDHLDASAHGCSK
jgi:predicted peptidase